MVFRSFSRFFSSCTARCAVVALSTVGLAVGLKIALSYKKIESKSATLKEVRHKRSIPKCIGWYDNTSISDQEPLLIKDADSKKDRLIRKEVRAIRVKRPPSHAQRCHLRQNLLWCVAQIHEGPTQADLLNHFGPVYFTPAFELPQWSLDFVSEQINHIVSDLVNEFQIDIDFRILLEYDIPPPGFEKCFMDATFAPPGPHEEPAYLPKVRSRPKAPLADADFLSRFKPDDEFLREGQEMGETVLPTYQGYRGTLSSYHRSHVLWSKGITLRVQEAETTAFEDDDFPEAADYFVYYDFNNAYVNEEQARKYKAAPTPARQKWIKENWKYWEEFQIRWELAQAYWADHPDEYYRYFPVPTHGPRNPEGLTLSSSDVFLVLEESNDALLDELEDGSTDELEEVGDYLSNEQEQPTEDRGEVFNDPAIISAVVHHQYSFEKADAPRADSARNSVSIKAPVFSLLYPEQNPRSLEGRTFFRDPNSAEGVSDVSHARHQDLRSSLNGSFQTGLQQLHHQNMYQQLPSAVKSDINHDLRPFFNSHLQLGLHQTHHQHTQQPTAFASDTKFLSFILPDSRSSQVSRFRDFSEQQVATSSQVRLNNH